MSAIELELAVLRTLRLEDGRSWGEAATEWQIADAEANSRPTAQRFITSPVRAVLRRRRTWRPFSIIALAKLHHAKLYALAADRDQGALLVDAVAGFVYRTPSLRDHSTSKHSASSAGTRAARWMSSLPTRLGLGAFGPTWSSWMSSHRGLRQRRLGDSGSGVLSLPKMPGCKLIVLTTAGDPAHFSKRILDHAKNDELWRVQEVAGPVPWLSSELLEEQRRRLPESSFRRLFLNDWTAAKDRLATPDTAACTTLDGPLQPEAGRPYAIGVDLGIRRDRTVAAVCTPRGPQPTIVLDRMQVWAPTKRQPVRLSTVESWLHEAARAFSGARLMMNPWQAVGMAQRLEDSRRDGQRVHVLAGLRWTARLDPAHAHPRPHPRRSRTIRSRSTSLRTYASGSPRPES